MYGIRVKFTRSIESLCILLTCKFEPIAMEAKIILITKRVESIGRSLAVYDNILQYLSKLFLYILQRRKN